MLFKNLFIHCLQQCLCSSVVERTPHMRLVAGSIPASSTNFDTKKVCILGCDSTGKSPRLLIWLQGFESSHPHQQCVFAISEETLKEYKETFVCSCREDRWKHNLILRDCRQRPQNTLLFFSKLQVVNEIRQHFIQIRPIFGIVTQLRRVSGS